MKLINLGIAIILFSQVLISVSSENMAIVGFILAIIGLILAIMGLKKD